MEFKVLIFYVLASIGIVMAIINTIKLNMFYEEKIDIAIATIINIDILGSEPLYYLKLATVGYYVDETHYISSNRILVSRFANVGDEVGVKYHIDMPSLLYNRIIEKYFIYLTISFASALIGLLISKI